MTDGAYLAVFTTNMGSLGDGVCLVRSGSVVGVNFGHTFAGALRGEGDFLASSLQFERQAGYEPPIDLPAWFELALEGHARPDGFELRGALPVQGATLTVVGRRVD